MDEYIKREEAIHIAFKSPFFSDSLMEEIKAIPAADVSPVRHGRWEQVKSWSTKAKYRCSVCGREIMSAAKVNIEKYPYCHCGAKMEVKE